MYPIDKKSCDECIYLSTDKNGFLICENDHYCLFEDKCSGVFDTEIENKYGDEW